MGATSSKATKPPTWFDLHLHEDLRLKRTALLPDFAAQLSQFLDAYLDRKNAVYATKLEGSLFPSTRDKARSNFKFTHLESNVVSGVATQTLTGCGIVASTLLFDLPSWSRVLTSSDRAFRVTQPVARADTFVFPNLAPEHGHNKSLVAADKADVDLLFDCGLQNFLLYEFKNLDAGHLETMKHVLNHNGDFVWLTCSGPNHCKHTEHSGANLTVTGHEVGPDARYNGLFNLPGSVAVKTATTSSNDNPDKAGISSALYSIVEERETSATQSVRGVDLENDNDSINSNTSAASSPSLSTIPKAGTLAAKKRMNHFKDSLGHQGRTRNASSLATTQPFSSLDTPNREVQLKNKARDIIQQASSSNYYHRQ